jgi:antitoxin (DNA-binding transcriptional repressor) of toxin-antitoxin stability system
MADADRKQQPQLVPSSNEERNWLPLAIAAAVVLVLAAVLVLVLEHGKPAAKVTPISAAPDPYAASLPLTRLAMSESANLAGGKVTYLDGHIANQGNRTVTSIAVQVLFRNAAHEVAQNETQPLKLIRMSQPYIDIEPVSAAPLKPGDEHDFRLIFDAVSPDWDGAYPDLRIVRVESK